MKIGMSRTCRYGIADRPRPPRRRRFQASDSQVFRKKNSGGYSHQSENSAAKRTMTGLKAPWYSRSIASPIPLVRA